jgi:hypothetical protein
VPQAIFKKDVAAIPNAKKKTPITVETRFIASNTNNNNQFIPSNKEPIEKKLKRIILK